MLSQLSAPHQPQTPRHPQWFSPELAQNITDSPPAKIALSAYALGRFSFDRTTHSDSEHLLNTELVTRFSAGTVQLIAEGCFAHPPASGTVFALRSALGITELGTVESATALSSRRALITGRILGVANGPRKNGLLLDSNLAAPSPIGVQAIPLKTGHSRVSAFLVFTPHPPMAGHVLSVGNELTWGSTYTCFESGRDWQLFAPPNFHSR